MGFLEFDGADEWYEADETTASRPASPPPRPTASRPPTSSGPRPTAPSPRPAPTSGRPAPSPSTGRPTPPTTRPASPSTRPAPSRPSTDWLGSLTRGLDAAGRYLPQAIDVGMRTADIVRQFQQPRGPAGGPPPSGGAPPAPGADAPFPVAPGTEPLGGYPPVAAEPEPAPAAPVGMPSPYPITGGPASPPAAPPGYPAGPPQGFDQLAMLFQALQQRQIPPLPSYGPSPYGGYPPPMYGQGDPMSMLQSILGNPQFQQAMQWPAMGGPRHVQLPLPAPGYPGHMRSVAIPMGAVMNTVGTLANQSRNQMHATTREDEAEVPEYLVDEQGDFIVDPAQPDDRSALVAHLFRLSDEAYRSGWFAAAEADGESGFDKEDAEIDCEAVGDGEDESEQWAREAGFTR